MRLLAALAELTFDGPPPMLKDLAASAALPPAKAHRYLVSFTRSGLVERDLATGRYRLGPVARRIGVAAIRSLDVVRLTTARLPEICAELKQSVALSIWTHNGPTVVWVEEVRRPITISTRVGEVLPLLASASGRVFGAYLPHAQTEAHVKREIAANRKTGPEGLPTKLSEAEELFATTREAGIGLTIGGLNETVNAFAAPIFDYRSALVAVIAVLGPADQFDVNLKGPLARGLIKAARELSITLGFKPPDA